MGKRQTDPELARALLLLAYRKVKARGDLLEREKQEREWMDAVERAYPLSVEYVSDSKSPGIKRAQELVMNDGYSKRRAAEIAEAEGFGKCRSIRRALAKTRWPDGPDD